MSSTTPNIKIVKKYRGKILSQKYLKEHPEIHEFLPSEKMFNDAYRTLKVKANGKAAKMELSENGIKTFIAK